MDIEVKLLHYTPIEILIGAIRQCYESQDNSDSKYGYISTHTPPLKSEIFILGPKDKALVERIVESGHTSTLEHVNFTFKLSGYSRALLQEKSRHRMASVSEKSTRYCLGKMKKEESFINDNIIDYERAKKYLVFTDVEKVDKASVYALEALRSCIIEGIPNDKSKYCLPDSLKSECYFTINARSLRNWFLLRTSTKALWEFRLLAYEMYNNIPEDYKFLFKDTVLI